MSEFIVWSNFYVVVGSAAGALIGLQFVVLTLVAQRQRRTQPVAAAAFSTPTIVHFATVLFLAALMLAPWQSVTPVAVIWGLIGVSGLAYEIFITHRIRKQDLYEPFLEDWLFHCVLPLVAYAVLSVSAFTSFSYIRGTLFAVGGSVLLFLFIGIHNAWDGVTWHVFAHKPPEVENHEIEE